MITILRLGHRCGRDARISTHVGLTARALGADKIVYSGEHDKKMMESVMDIDNRWGPAIEVVYEKNWKAAISKFNGVRVHLTIYGLLIQNEIAEIRQKTKSSDLLIVVGGEKVPPFVYHNVDYNIAVTSQPHSEVAALAVFLHELFEGKELSKCYKNAKIRVVPCANGKDVKLI